jgi:hypothetical protein
MERTCHLEVVGKRLADARHCTCSSTRLTRIRTSTFPRFVVPCIPLDGRATHAIRFGAIMSHASSSSRKPRASASLNTDDSSAKLTPSPRSSHSSDGPALTDDQNAFELRPITSHTEPSSAQEDVEEDNLLPRERRASIDSVQSYELYTPDEDRDVLKKLDRRLVSFMALLYCLSFLDRSSE